MYADDPQSLEAAAKAFERIQKGLQRGTMSLDSAAKYMERKLLSARFKAWEEDFFKRLNDEAEARRQARRDAGKKLGNVETQHNLKTEAAGDKIER